MVLMGLHCQAMARQAVDGLCDMADHILGLLADVGTTPIPRKCSAFEQHLCCFQTALDARVQSSPLRFVLFLLNCSNQIVCFMGQSRFPGELFLYKHRRVLDMVFKLRTLCFNKMEQAQAQAQAATKQAPHARRC